VPRPPRSPTSSPGGSDRPDKPGPSLRTRALRLLARREHSRTELERRLAPHAEDPESLSTLLDALAERGWLSEPRLVEQVVHARRARYGSLRIRQELTARGVSREGVDEAQAELKRGDLDAARSAWRKRFGRPPRDAAERARQLRFLLGRGFPAGVASRVLRDAAG